MSNNITYKLYGDSAILIEWQAIIDKVILDEVLLVKNLIRENYKANFVDLIQGYNSLTILFKDPVKHFNNEVSKLKAIISSKPENNIQTYFRWEIPVCYDEEFGIDLVEISYKNNLEINEIIHLHTNEVYKIYFIGFLPGFLYLGGLNEQLFFDRKPNPRLNVKKGSVGIGGKQTGVYPNNSAGGWNIIGNSPILFFDSEKETPSFAKAGDEIKFKAITKFEYERIQYEISVNKYQILKFPINA